MKSPPTGIIWIYQAGSENRDQIGSKAARLGQLGGAGFRVPGGFSLAAAAYHQHILEHSQLATYIENQDYAALRAGIQSCEIHPEVKQALLAAYRGLLAQIPVGRPAHVAVRSSSTAEDLKQHSFAGLYSSYLNVTNEAELLDAVRACWASYWNDEAVAYRERVGINHAAHGMAVLVQGMVPAVLAGVLFTQISGKNTELALIEFTSQSGEALMSGDAQAVKLFVDRRTGRQVRAQQGDLELNVSRLLSMGLQIENMLGAPQDIEWAMDATGGLWVLQTRPVTSQLDAHLGGSNGASGDDLEDKEWLLTYDEPFSTLGCEIASERYRYWVAGINASFRTNFAPEMRDRDGLLYYRPTWRKVGLPLKLWMNFWRLAAWLGSERTYRQYEHQILPAYLSQLDEIEQVNLAELDGTALLDLLYKAVRLYLEFQFTSYAVGAAATLSAGLLDRACRILFGSQKKWDALDLLVGLDDVSIQRELEVYRLGQLLQPYFATLEPDQGLRYTDLESLCDQSGRFGGLWPALESFLRKYGYLWADRYPRDPAWEFNTEALVSSLWIAAQVSPEESLEIRHQQQQQRREEAVNQALAVLSKPGGLPGRKLIFNLLLRRAEKLFPYKESRNHYTYQGMMVVRQVAREIGSRMAHRQLLSSAGDLFFLEFDEIEKLWNSPRAPTWLLKKIAERKATYQRSRRHIQQRNTAIQQRLSAGSVEAIEFKGDPCSPGLAKGPARLVNGPGELQRVRPGEIVVCTQLRPAWSAVFSRAGGLVIEMGSLLSHGSTLAREYGIPAVINVANITGQVRENDWLVVDGNLGRVAIERSEIQPAESQEE